MLSYADYSLATGLRSVEAKGAQAAGSADCSWEAIQVGLHAIKNATGITLKVHVNLELARCEQQSQHRLTLNMKMEANVGCYPWMVSAISPHPRGTGRSQSLREQWEAMDPPHVPAWHQKYFLQQVL